VGGEHAFDGKLEEAVQRLEECVRIALGRQQRRVIIDPGAASGRPNEWSPIPSPGARD